ncbi:hypothetical protein GOD37_27575 [Sinorhizobium medicae]|nr:hypothetical protein [Sinorhizobium medicae]
MKRRRLGRVDDAANQLDDLVLRKPLAHLAPGRIEEGLVRLCQSQSMPW